MRLSSHLFIGSALCAALCVSSCREDLKFGSVKVLAVIPNTGSFETRGERYKNAMQMAVLELERGLKTSPLPGNVLEGGVQLFVVDSGDGKTKESKAAARDRIEAVLAENPDIVAAITATGNAHKLTLPLGLRDGFAVIENASGAKWDEFIKLGEGEGKFSPDRLKYVFSARAVCHDLAVIAGDFILEKGWNKVWLTRGDKTHDKMHVRVVRETLAAGGYEGSIYPDPLAGELDSGAVAAEQIEFSSAKDGSTGPYSRTDYVEYVKAELTKIDRETGSLPDVVFWHLRGDSYNVGFFKAFRTLQERQFFSKDMRGQPMPKLVTCGMARNSALVSIVPGTTPIVDFLAGNLWFAMRGPIDSEGTMGTFKDDFLEYSGLTSDTWAAAVHDSMMVIGLGVAKANSLDRDSVRDGIESTMTGRPMGATPAVGMEGQPGAGATLVGYKQAAKAFAAIARGEDIDYNGPAGPLTINSATRGIPGRYYIEAIEYTAGADGGNYCTESRPQARITPVDLTTTVDPGPACGL